VMIVLGVVLPGPLAHLLDEAVSTLLP
jgi:hypothetical protein